MKTIQLFIYITLITLVYNPAYAISCTVNTEEDLIDTLISDGFCDASSDHSNVCSLRAAIMEPCDIITVPAGLYVLTIEGDDDTSFSGDLDILAGSTTISGAGIGMTIIDGSNIDRIFDIHDNNEVNVNNLTLQNGGNHVTSIHGGAIKASIFNINLSLTNVEFFNNTANAGAALSVNNVGTSLSQVVIKNCKFNQNYSENLGVTNEYGNAVWCRGCDLLITDTSIYDNHSGQSSVYSQEGKLKIINSTISTNDGIGIVSSNNSATIKFSTISNNTSRNLSQFSFNGTHDFEVGNSILQKDTGFNCFDIQTFVSLGNNIISDDTCGLTLVTDLENTDAQLGILGNNGGSNFTHLPEITSPAVDIVSLANCTDINNITLTSDQRGESRPIGLMCDSGAVEVNIEIIFANGFE